MRHLIINSIRSLNIIMLALSKILLNFNGRMNREKSIILKRGDITFCTQYT